MRQGSFQAQIDGFTRSTGRRANRQRIEMTSRLFSAIIRDTPVLSGLLRGNWQATGNAPAAGTLDRTEQEDPRPTVAATRWGTTVYLTNNLPYAQRVEYGHSSVKAPDGMVRRNVARLGAIARNVTSEDGS